MTAIISTHGIAISIHAPREGRDHGKYTGSMILADFNPRAPRGARQFVSCIGVILTIFQSTRPARGATRADGKEGMMESIFQSTRPARGATIARPPAAGVLVISIHAPREGRDLCLPESKSKRKGFQSTRPAWGATDAASCRKRECLYFNPRAPRGARRIRALRQRDGLAISIHAPREGRDEACKARYDALVISIHAPREGRDFASSAVAEDYTAFQSTRPARGATTPRLSLLTASTYFNPRAPRGARPTTRAS